MDIKIDEESFSGLCDLLGDRDADLKTIITQFGYPPFWSRRPGFETLIHIILEQQVSLASAKAALARLQTRIKRITPAAFLTLSDEELKTCYFSRQKIRYSRELAGAIHSKNLNLKKLETQSGEVIKTTLKKLPGIGDWTVDVYLMMALHRPDCFPLGDIALINSLKDVKKLPKETPKENLTAFTKIWEPFRTVAAYLLWHSYLSKKAMRYGV